MAPRLASDKFNIETPSPRRLRRRIVKSEPEACDLYEDGGNSKRKKYEDHSVSDMTLKELKERCKKKKKFLETASLSKQTTNSSSCFDTNQEYDIVEIEEEESDLETPIITWKRRDSCKVKSKRKCIRKQVCLSLDSGVSVEVINHSGSEYSLPSLTGKHDPPNIKVEILEPDCADRQNGVCLANGSAPEAIEGSSQVFSDEAPRSVSGYDVVNVESSAFITDSPRCVVNEASFDFVELCEPISLCLSETVNSGETKESGFPQPISLSPLYELTVQGNASYLFPDQISEDPIPVTQDKGSDIRESCEGNLCQPHISCHMDCATGIERLGTEIGDNSICKGLNFGGSSVSDVEGEVDSNGDSPTHLKGDRTGHYGSLHNSLGDSYPTPKAHIGIDPVNDDSPLVETHSICITGGDLSAGADRDVECLLITSPTATVGFIARELFESQNGAQPDNSPKKLLSTRNAISPTSQEQLLHSMDIEELHDCAGKSGSDLQGTMATIKPGEADAKFKSWNDLPQFVPKGILKASHGSLLAPLDGNENSDASRSQKAVAFSQRQMQDIESLAVKLMEKLKSMKDIVKDSLSVKEYSPTPPKYTADEMRAAIQNAGEAEETTKRWLSMMARDCNRFCKIMRSGRKKTAAERKKITFADQAGGRLCHVKILEDCPDSGLVPESEGVHMDVQA
ncbi:hypothetical protein IFM89_016218 [Coptis chinensis]|uniref:Uncharacterized protein n=1 Tax=Coptis chinensis TaxID=261450 RepID=A0A835I5A0_9MAGN|nr:hypothetical protein IFM89_016218 [Coptis chinensis]